MLVEQALFTSAQTRHARGYHLVARSPGISDDLAQALSVWGPTHDSLLDPSATAESLNFFCLDGDWAALSRTVNGESEYSNRGGLRLETNMVVFRTDQLGGYDQHPVLLAETAMALGHLRLRAATPLRLDAVELPQTSCRQLVEFSQRQVDREDLIAEIARATRQSRVIVVGSRQPRSLLGRVLDRLPRHERATLSFSTGLKPSLLRTFRLQFVPEADAVLRDQMAATDVICLDARATSRLSGCSHL